MDDHRRSERPAPDPTLDLDDHEKHLEPWRWTESLPAPLTLPDLAYATGDEHDPDSNT